MRLIRKFTGLTAAQRHAYFAALGGWTLDAFDFFIFIVSLSWWVSHCSQSSRPLGPPCAPSSCSATV